MPLPALHRAHASARFSGASVPPWWRGSMCSIVADVSPASDTTSFVLQCRQRPTQARTPRTSARVKVASVATIDSTVRARLTGGA